MEVLLLFILIFTSTQFYYFFLLRYIYFTICRLRFETTLSEQTLSPLPAGAWWAELGRQEDSAHLDCPDYTEAGGSQVICHFGCVKFHLSFSYLQ